jgi:hypothetical protein
MINLPDPKAPPNKLDKLALGPDCSRHPLVGCIIANNGVGAGAQARNYLWSLRNATIHQILGRDGDMSHDEYLGFLYRLSVWEQTNHVPMPPPAQAADHAHATKQQQAPKPAECGSGYREILETQKEQETMSDQFDGIENEDMRNYLREQSGGNQSAVFTIAYRKAMEKGRTHEEAVLEAIEADRKNTWGWNYKTDPKTGAPIPQGIGSKGNENISHFDALRKRVQQGFESPSAYDDAVKELWRRDPKRAAAIGLPQIRA